MKNAIQQECASAIAALCQRLDAIAEQAAQADGGFPLYSIGSEDRWKISGGGSWTAGFWLACWWLRAKISGASADQQHAMLLRQRLADKTQIASIHRSMLFWYGAGLAASEASDVSEPAASALAQQGASALAASFNSELGCFALGVELGGGSAGDRRINLDSLAPLLRLLHLADAARYTPLLQQHLATLRAACFTSEGAWHSEAIAEDGVFHAEGVAGDWSRGQAWGMLGLTTAATLWGGRYIDDAQCACEYWRRTRGQALPLDRLSSSEAWRDPSAAVIAALAMWQLAPLLADGEMSIQWRNEAQALILQVIRSEYFVRDASGGALFCGACYSIRPGQLAMVESSWSHYLLLEALMLVDCSVR